MIVSFRSTYAATRTLVALMAFALVVFVSQTAGAAADFQFVDVTATAGLTSHTPPVGMSSGAAIADFDDDGDPDIFVPTEYGTPHRLYRNDSGTFVDIAASAGVNANDRGRAALWFDYDADGLLDLVVMGDCFSIGVYTPPSGLPCPAPPVRLFRQTAPGVFSDQAAAAGLSGAFVTFPPYHVGGLSAGDLNNDGYLDLLISIWGSSDRWLFLNDGDGTFTDVTTVSGVNVDGPGGSAYDWASTIFDFDGDGNRDIFQAVDFGVNELMVNFGGARFANVGNEVGVNTSFHEMGIAVSDPDNDGDFDVYMTNIHTYPPLGVEHNVLFRNDTVGGDLSFTDVGVSAGVGETDWGWGTTFLDGDRDGFLDLAATNGFNQAANPIGVPDQSRFFSNDGGGSLSFTDVSTTVNFDDMDWGSGLYALDYDSDGDQDLLQIVHDLGIPRLLENQQSGPALSHHYLTIKPRMTGPNNRAIGAIVRVTAGGKQMARFVSAGTSMAGQEPAEAFFGLGTATSADVTVEFPDGSVKTLLGVAADQILTVTSTIEALISAPSVATTTSGPVSWTVTYSGADSVTLAPADILIAATGTVAASFSVTGTGTTTRTVTATGITGVGTLGFDVAAGSASILGAPHSAFGPSAVTLVGDQTDGDGDFSPDSLDNCVSDFNPLQEDADGSNLGDACNDAFDVDGDEFETGFDNCPSIYNPSQVDTNMNGVGDACEGGGSDVDQDGVPDLTDNCPTIPNPLQEDANSNGIGDVCEYVVGVPGANPLVLAAVLLLAGFLVLRRQDVASAFR